MSKKADSQEGPASDQQFDDESTEGFTPKQRELLEAALRVMNRKGYDGSRTREIAAEAGVSEATLFKNFSTKRHILDALFKPFMVTVIRPTMLASAKALLKESDGRPMEEVLRQIVRDRLALFRGKRALITTLVLEAIRHPDLMQIVRERVIPEIIEILDAVLDAARSRGELGDIDRTVFIRSFMSLVVGHVAISSILPDELGSDDDEAASTQIARLIMHGIGATGGNGQ